VIRPLPHVSISLKPEIHLCTGGGALSLIGDESVIL